MAMNSEIVTRPLEQADAQTWDAMWVKYLAFYKTELPDEARTHAFGRLLNPDEKVHGRIAESDGKALGLVHYIYHDHLWRPEGVCYLQDLFTNQEARGRGVGRALINSVYAAADAQGVNRVYWLTQETNTQARLLYDNIADLSPFVKYDRR